MARGGIAISCSREFGLPTYRRGGPPASTLLVEEDAAAAYTAAALEALRRAGCLGAMLWCYSDYDPALWESPPLDLAPHERSFGLWRADGSPKPSVAVVAAFAGAERCAPRHADAWIDIDPDEFFLDPSAQLPRLYRRYRTVAVQASAPTSLVIAYASDGAARTASRRSRSRAVARQIELSAAP